MQGLETQSHKVVHPRTIEEAAFILGQGFGFRSNEAVFERSNANVGAVVPPSRCDFQKYKTDVSVEEKSRIPPPILFNVSLTYKYR